MDKTLGLSWTRCVEIGQSQKNLSNTSSHKQPQESSRKVKSHKIVTQQKSSHKYPLMRMNRHRSTCETHGQTDGRTDGQDSSYIYQVADKNKNMKSRQISSTKRIKY